MRLQSQPSSSLTRPVGDTLHPTCGREPGHLCGHPFAQLEAHCHLPFPHFGKLRTTAFPDLLYTDADFFHCLPQIHPWKETGNQLSVTPNLPITQHCFKLLNSCWVARVTKAVSVFFLFELLLKIYVLHHVQVIQFQHLLFYGI